MLTERQMRVLRLLEAGVPLRRPIGQLENGALFAFSEIPAVVRPKMLQELIDLELIVFDETYHRYRLTDHGRDRVLVLDRVRDFTQSLQQ